MRFQASPALPRPDRASALVLFRGDGNKALPKDLDAGLRTAASAAFQTKEFQGKKGESLLLHGAPAGRLLLVGLGDRKPEDPDALRASRMRIVEALRAA